MTDIDVAPHPPRFADIPLEAIEESADNPRRTFDDAALADLTASVRTTGVLVPLLLRPLDADGHYALIAGARRLRAARAAGLTTVPAVIRDAPGDAGLEEAIVENLQREQVPPLEEARALLVLISSGDAPSRLERVHRAAARLGKSPGYVWDRLTLLDLVPAAQALLTRGLITVAHAIRLARLTPKDQARVIDPDQGGLVTHESRLWTDDEREDLQDPYAGRKAVTVRELDLYIAEHVRFRVDQAAAAAPLDFGAVADRVQVATEQPGRGQKVVPITHDYHVRPSAKAEGERTYCHDSWKRADGSDKKSPTCDRSLLGVVVVGPGYGEAFEVCVHKDCDIHWKAERLAKEKRAKAEGPAAGGAKRDTDWEAREREQKARQAKEKAARQAFKAAQPAILAAVLPKLKALKVARLRDLILAMNLSGTTKAVKDHLGTARTADDVLRHLLLMDLLEDFTHWNAHAELPRAIKKVYGVDVAAMVKAQAKAPAREDVNA